MANASDYVFGYEQYLVELLNNRTFEHCAKFIEPLIKPDMLVLDCGCGPGSITIGFARRVPHGKVIAVDIEPSQLKLAQTTSLNNRITNIEFQVDNILKLSFPDNFFDLVYANGVVCQTANYNQAISELYRVVKPNGLVAIREPYFGTKIVYPEDPKLAEASAYYHQLLLKNQVQILIGRKLRSLFLKAGFKETIGSANTDNYGDIQALMRLCTYMVGQLDNSPLVKQDIAANNIAQEKIEQYQQAWKNFIKNPDAFIASIWCQIIGIK